MGKIVEPRVGIDIGKRFLLFCVLTGAVHISPTVKRDARYNRRRSRTTANLACCA
jgi:hypothetical protein